MGWLVVFVVFISVFFAGFSFKSLFLFVILASVSFGLTHFFLTNEWGLDGLFEELFKIVELFGFGAPHRLENRISYSSFYTDGGLRSLSEIPKPLEECFKTLIDNIIRDFIRTWYHNVGEGEHFISETRESLEMLCLEGYRRASQIDSHYLIEQVIVVFHGHLERFNKAMAIVKAKDPKLRLSISSSQLLCQTYKSQLASEPPSLSKPAAELSYLRNVIDSLLVAMIPKDTFSCDPGRFILREILTIKVVEPLVRLLTDPDWIGEAVIEILSGEEDGVVNKSKVVGESLVVKKTDNVDDVEPGLSEEMHPLPLVENATPVTVATQAKPQTEETMKMPRKESVEDMGERIEIMSPGHFEENSDFRWSVSSQRQPPVGESQHDNTDSFLVISVDESEENSMDERTPNRRNWSTEVVPPSSVDNLTSCSLSSSWGVGPSSQDDSFNMLSFEDMKANLPNCEGNVDVGTKLGELGHSLKELTCCHKFEESGDTYRPMSMVAERGSSDEGSDIEEPCPRLRTRSLSLPGCGEMFENKSSLYPCHSELSRSVSVPTKLSFADVDDQNIQGFSTPASVRGIYGSPLYNTSLGSGTDSFKSISSEEDLLDSYIERGEEAVEHCEDFDSHSFGSPWAGARHITKQVSFEDSYAKQKSNLPTDDLTGSKDTSSPFNKDKFRAEKMALQSKKDYPELDDIRESSYEAAEKYPPDDDAVSRRKCLHLGFGAQNTESFSDAVLTAGKKFVSNLKPPFRFDSLSSSSNGSAKSAEASTTSEGESLDHSSGTQQKFTAMKKSLDAGRVRAATFGGRKLSRSDAVIEESIDSDGETCYSTPQGELAQEIMEDGNMEETVDGRNLRSVKRMHPSQLISIPSTVIALETTWEPGRNKYTLYTIEYDIRIWYEVYNAAIRQAKDEARKEKMKRKLYAREKEPEDEELSLEAIKRRVPLKRKICRRYREFMELHNRLSAGKLAIHLKDILKPNRKYNLPFGRLDPQVVEGRRELLQYYLGSLICKPPLRDSEDLKQFLGVTGGEQVSFIKPSVAQIVSQSVHVPRVDKMLSRQMTKVIDTIKTAFDSAEEEQATPEENSTAASENAVLPWKLANYKDGPDGDIDLDQENSLTSFYYTAFLANQEEFNPPTPPSPIHSFSEETLENGDEQDGPQLWEKKWNHEVAPTDSEDEAVGWDTTHQVRQSLGPRTAGDGSDNPDDPVALSSDNQSASVLHPAIHQRGRSGALLKKHKDNLPSSTPAVAHKPLGLSLSEPAPISKSVEGITTAASSSKFQFKPQKILEAAKRIGRKTESTEGLDAPSTTKEKKQGTLKKFLQEKQKIISGTERAPSSKQLPLHPEDPCTISKVDQPSNVHDESLLDRASPATDLQCPLSDAILTLLCELLKERGSWLTVDRVQQAFTATLGGLFEWHVQSGIDDITSDDRWALYLDKLNEAIWPGGKLQEGSEKPKTEIEKARTRKEAVQALMDAFPGFISLLFGPRVYHQTAVNVIDSMQYPQINKILLYTLLELLLSEFVPEIQDTLQFYKHITTQK